MFAQHSSVHETMSFSTPIAFVLSNASKPCGSRGFSLGLLLLIAFAASTAIAQAPANNTLPTATPVAQQIADTESLTFKVSDFGFMDADGDSLQHIVLVTLPPMADGRLMNGMNPARELDEIATANIGSLVFWPANKSDDYITSFTFKVNDGTIDSRRATMVINVRDSGEGIDHNAIIKFSLVNLARGMGWDMVDSISNRISLIKQTSAGEIRPADLIYWSSIGNNDLDFGSRAAYSHDGDLASLRLGMEVAMDQNQVLGVAYTYFDAEVAIRNQLTNHQAQLDASTHNFNPYILWIRDKSRAWATFGIGRGDLEYSERASVQGTLVGGNADLEMFMVAIGGEYEFRRQGKMTILGRTAMMETRLRAKNLTNEIFDNLKTSANGMRNELEVGWNLQPNTAEVRPYLTVGMRQDRNNIAAELGAGMQVRAGSFNLDAQFRTQDDAKDDEFHRTAYALTIGYDRDNDNQGFSFYLNRDAGAVHLTPFSGAMGLDQDVATLNLLQSAESQAVVTDSVNLGYAFSLGDAVAGHDTLTVRASSEFIQGETSRSSLVLHLEPAMSKAYSFELSLSRQHGIDLVERSNAVLLKFNLEF